MLLCEVTMPECDTCNNYEWDEERIHRNTSALQTWMKMITED